MQKLAKHTAGPINLALVLLGALVVSTGRLEADGTTILYGVSDANLSDSQFFKIEGLGTAGLLGPFRPNEDFEALDIDPTTGVLYVIAGADSVDPGAFYRVDKATGAVTLIGHTGATGRTNEIPSASFHPDGTLWAFQQGFGLVTVNLANGALTPQWAATGTGIGKNWEGLAWDLEGRYLYGAEGPTLYRWDPSTQTATVICASALPDPTEALDFRPDGVLFGGSHNPTPENLRVFSIDIGSCTIGASGYQIPLEDIESLAFELTPAPPPGCRITAGGIAPDGDTDPGSVAEIEKATFGGQVGAPFGFIGCFDRFDQIQGNWTHQRHRRSGSFHAMDYNSLVCGCDGTFDGRLCNPDDREPGPEPRPAPANMACFSGVGDYNPTNGNRSLRVAFRVEVEDRGEPAAGSNAGSLEDVYHIRIWIPGTGETADTLADNVCCTKTAPLDVRTPDVSDGGNLIHGNIQIHPQTPNSTP